MAKYESSVKQIYAPQSAVYAKLSDLNNLATIKERISDPAIQERMKASGQVPEGKLDAIKEKIEQRYNKRRGYCIIVVAEGAKPKGGSIIGTETGEVGYQHIKLGGIGNQLAEELKAAGVEHDIRCTILGHLQRGGTPIAFDRILASACGPWNWSSKAITGRWWPTAIPTWWQCRWKRQSGHRTWWTPVAGWSIRPEGWALSSGTEEEL